MRNCRPFIHSIIPLLQTAYRNAVTESMLVLELRPGKLQTRAGRNKRKRDAMHKIQRLVGAVGRKLKYPSAHHKHGQPLRVSCLLVDDAQLPQPGVGPAAH